MALKTPHNTHKKRNVPKLKLKCIIAILNSEIPAMPMMKAVCDEHSNASVANVKVARAIMSDKLITYEDILT